MFARVHWRSFFAVICGRDTRGNERISNERSYPLRYTLSLWLFSFDKLVKLLRQNILSEIFDNLTIFLRLKKWKIAEFILNLKKPLNIHKTFERIKLLPTFCLNIFPPPSRYLCWKSEGDKEKIPSENFFFAFSMPGSSLMIFDIFSFCIRLISSANEILTFFFLSLSILIFTPVLKLWKWIPEKMYSCRNLAFARERFGPRGRNYLPLNNIRKKKEAENKFHNLSIPIDFPHISPLADFLTCLYCLSLSPFQNQYTGKSSKRKEAKKAKLDMWSEWEKRRKVTTKTSRFT